MEDNLDIDIEEKKKENSRIYVLFYSFFLIPFMIAVFGAVFFLLFRFITYETNDASELLNQVKIGAASKRWQSAFELSKILSDPELVPTDDNFKQQLISAYKKSIHDDPKVRSFLAMAIGSTKDSTYGQALSDGLDDENQDTRLAAIQATGMVRFKGSISKIDRIIQNSSDQGEKLAATIALGMVGEKKAIPTLVKLLEDEEPNIRWDAAIALAKMGDKSGVNIISRLLDRSYLKDFKEVNVNEQKQVIKVAIRISTILKDAKFKEKLQVLAKTDEDLSIRNLAIKTLEKSYNN